MVLMTEHTS